MITLIAGEAQPFVGVHSKGDVAACLGIFLHHPAIAIPRNPGNRCIALIDELGEYFGPVLSGVKAANDDEFCLEYLTFEQSAHLGIVVLVQPWNGKA